MQETDFHGDILVVGPYFAWSKFLALYNVVGECVLLKSPSGKLKTFSWWPFPPNSLLRMLVLIVLVNTKNNIAIASCVYMERTKLKPNCYTLILDMSLRFFS